jgi:uncharacterized protein YukE
MNDMQQEWGEGFSSVRFFQEFEQWRGSMTQDAQRL